MRLTKEENDELHALKSHHLHFNNNETRIPLHQVTEVTQSTNNQSPKEGKVTVYTAHMSAQIMSVYDHEKEAKASGLIKPMVYAPPRAEPQQAKPGYKPRRKPKNKGATTERNSSPIQVQQETGNRIMDPFTSRDEKLSQ